MSSVVVVVGLSFFWSVQQRYNRFKSRSTVSTHHRSAFSQLSPARSPPKAVTPGSVKVLMLVEAGIIGFLSYWVLNEYAYNAYFRSYADQILLSHITTYSAALGLGIGVAGSAAAAMFYKILQNAKRRLETVVAPKIRGAVDKLLPTIPTTDTASHAQIRTDAVSPQPPAQPVSPPVTAIIPVSDQNKPKTETA